MNQFQVREVSLHYYLRQAIPVEEEGHYHFHQEDPVEEEGHCHLHPGNQVKEEGPLLQLKNRESQEDHFQLNLHQEGQEVRLQLEEIQAENL